MEDAWEMRRRAISRLSATLVVAAALGLSVAAAHAVHAAAGSRNSSRRCASPREIRTPGRWRRNRLAHSSIANRRLPRSDAPRNRRKRHSRRPWRAPSVSINKEIELGVRGRWPPLSECTICSDPASRSPFREGKVAPLPKRSGANMLRPLMARGPRGTWGFCRYPDPPTC